MEGVHLVFVNQAIHNLDYICTYFYNVTFINTVFVWKTRLSSTSPIQEIYYTCMGIYFVLGLTLKLYGDLQCFLLMNAGKHLSLVR